MAAYAKSAILADVRRILREPVALLYSDTELNAYIDEAARKTSILTLCNRTREAKNMIDAQQDMCALSTTADFIKIDFVTADKAQVGAEIGLQRISMTQVGMGGVGSLAPGTPKFYSYYDGTVFLWPAPDSDWCSDAAPSYIYIYGPTAVDNYGGAGSETLPDELQHFTIDYALSCAYTKAGKHSLAGLHMQKFMQNCMVHRRDVYDMVGIADSVDSTHIPTVTVQPQ